MEDCENFLCLFNRLKSEIFREATEYKNSFLSELKNLEEFEELEKNEIEKIKKDEKNYFESILGTLDRKLGYDNKIGDIILHTKNIFSQEDTKIENLKNDILSRMGKNSISNRFKVGFLKDEDVEKVENFYENLKNVNEYYKKILEKKVKIYENFRKRYINEKEKTSGPEFG